MRKYIRHPAEIPIEFEIIGGALQTGDRSRNFSHGGICFRTKRCLDRDTILILHIQKIIPNFEVATRVVWCREHADHVEVGVEFINPEDAFKTRLVEQICYIKKYQEEVLLNEGRQLSDEEAATEWTEKFAKNFPTLD
jgi:hypothetical protein